MTLDDGHVVFVSQMFPPETGGNASRIHDTATHLEDEGWTVSVLAPPPSYPPGVFDRTKRRVQTESVDGVTIHRLWTWQPTIEDPGMLHRLPYYLLFGLHAMLWLLWNVREYDVVVTSTPPISTGAPGLLAAALGKPWVVDVRDLWIDASVTLGYLEAGSPTERLSRWFQGRVLAAADLLTVTTHTLGWELANRYQADLEEKTLVLPNGVDTHKFRPGVRSGIESSWIVHTGARAEVAGKRVAPDGYSTVDGGPPVIVYTGNLGSAQDLETCIRAMAHLEHSDAVFRLVGRGDRESELRRLATELGVDHRVQFEGLVAREAVPDVLNEATIGVGPLHDSGTFGYAMPTKVYEYLACALPTVVTGRGEIERFITEAGAGLHVENDPEQLASQLDELLVNRRLRLELAAKGRQHVVDNYDRHAIARRFSTALSGLADPLAEA